MRVSIPGVPGVYYDTDSGTTAIGVATTAIGQKAPKPKGYAIQLLPYLWSFNVDLHEVPNDHPIQYLHPEGARSLGELSPERGVREAGTELEGVLRFVWSVNQEVESATNQLIGRKDAHDGTVIEIHDGSVGVDGEELTTDEFDIDADATGETEIDIEEGTAGEPTANRETESFGVDHATNDVETESADTDGDSGGGDEFDPAGTDDPDPNDTDDPGQTDTDDFEPDEP